MDYSDFVLSGYDPKLLRKIAIEQETRQKQLNKEARKQLKQEKQNRIRAAQTKPVTLLTVKHKPTYSIISYERISGEETRRPQNFRTTPAFTSKSEIQSMKSQSRLKNAVGWMLLFADKKRVYSKAGRFNVKTGKWQHNFSFKLAFITLTLSDVQSHPDDYIKEHLLQPFLYWLNRYYQALYVWKAESQLNGNIHFHITIDTFVPWRSVRAKWNSLLSKHGYCKINQDGSNDKGDSATQIKSVLKDSECAKDIGGYMSKKDSPKDVLMKAFKYLTEQDFEIHKETVNAYKWITKFKGKSTDLPSAKIIFDTVKQSYDNANLHCKFDPELTHKSQDTTWYKRVIDGRLWGCSENLSGVNVFIDETFVEFKKEETIFFRQNPDIYNLGTKVISREKEKFKNVPVEERTVRGITDEDIEHRYRFMKNVFIHKHLAEMKKGGTLQRLIHEEKLSRQKNFQTYFPVESLN